MRVAAFLLMLGVAAVVCACAWAVFCWVVDDDEDD